MQRHTRSPGLHTFIGNNIAHIIYAERGIQRLRIGECKGRELLNVKLKIGIVRSLAASNAANRVAIGTEDGKVHIFNAALGKLINTIDFDIKETGVKDVIFSPDGKYIACSMVLSTDELPRLTSSRIVMFTPDHKEFGEFKLDIESDKVAHSLSFSKGGENFSYMDYEGVLTTINIARVGVPIRHDHLSTADSIRIGGYYTNALLSSDSKYVISLIDNVQILRVSDLSGRQTLAYRYSTVRSFSDYLALSPDGNRLAIIAGNVVTFFDARRWIRQFKTTIPFRMWKSTTTSFSEDSTKLIISSIDEGTHFLKIPKDYHTILDHKSELDALNITLFPEYIAKLRKDRQTYIALQEYKLSGGISDLITSYT